MLTTTGNRETLNAGGVERQRRLKPVNLGPLEVFQWVCRFCHRGFESEGYRAFQPKKLTCPDCAAAYEAKVEQNFELDDACRAAAVKVGQSENKTEQRDRLLLWRQLADETREIKTRLQFSEMLRIAANYIANPSAARVTAGAGHSRGDW
jgi:hypothetical protein